MIIFKLIKRTLRLVKDIMSWAVDRSLSLLKWVIIIGVIYFLAKKLIS